MKDKKEMKAIRNQHRSRFTILNTQSQEWKESLQKLQQFAIHH